MVLHLNTITAVTHLHIEFVISCYDFQLYFIMVETKTADAVTESYMWGEKKGRLEDMYNYIRKFYVNGSKCLLRS